MRLMRRRAGPIAIDFGSHALRVMQVAGQHDSLEVIAAASHQYRSRAQGAAPDQGEVVESLRSILGERDFVGRQAVSALGNHELLTKNIRLPEMPVAELASAVRFEAIERISGLGDDAEIRFIPAGSVVGQADPQQELIVLAAPESVVRRHLELLSEVGLQSVGIDATPYALFRPFERYLRRSEDRDQVNVFVDVGYSGTRIVITRGSLIVFTRSFEVGGAAFDRLVAGRMSLDTVQASELRRSVAEAGAEGAAPGTQLESDSVESVEAAVRPAWEKLAKEISLCLRYYVVTFRGARPDTVTCVGGECLNAHHLEFLSEATGLRCRVGHPLRGMKSADGVPLKESGGPMADWTTAVGLAMSPALHAVREVA